MGAGVPVSQDAADIETDIVETPGRYSSIACAGLPSRAGCQRPGQTLAIIRSTPPNCTASRHLNGHEKSAKHRKAEQMIRDGAMLRIIGETDFRALMSNS